MDQFDWNWPKKLERRTVEKLIKLDFLKEKNPTNILIFGAQGLGKTMIAKNLALKAVLSGHTALFTTSSKIVTDLGQQEGSNLYTKRLNRYIKPDLLVIDELGYLSFDCRAADLLFEVISRRYEVKPIVLTTNLAFKDWNNIFPAAACLTAMIDRLTHFCEIISIEGSSFRHKESQEKRKAQ